MLIEIHHKTRFAILLLLLSASPSKADQFAQGAELYRRCAGCHLSSAEGVLGMFPPLINRLGPLVDTQPGRDYLVMVIQAGLMGGIEIGKVTYQGIMPAQGPAMTDKEIAAVLNYLLETFNANTSTDNWRRFTKYEVAVIKSRYPNLNGHAVHSLRQLAFSVKK